MKSYTTTTIIIMDIVMKTREKLAFLWVTDGICPVFKPCLILLTEKSTKMKTIKPLLKIFGRFN